MKKFIALAALAVLSGPAPASDFSRLFKPEVIRSVLLPFPRMQEKQCAALVLARGEKEAFLPPALRTELLDTVAARLAIDTGDTRAGPDALYDQAMGLTDDPFSLDPELRQAKVEALRASCAPMFAAIKAKGVAASLSPAPTGPIALPDGPHCYVAAQEAKRRKIEHVDATTISEALDQLLFTLPSADEVRANRAAVAAEVAKLAAAPVDERLLEVEVNFACLPAIGDLAKRFQPGAGPVEH